MGIEVAKLPIGELIIQMVPQNDTLFLLSDKGNVYIFDAFKGKLLKIIECNRREKNNDITTRPIHSTSDPQGRWHGVGTYRLWP